MKLTVLMVALTASVALADIGDAKWSSESLPVKYQIATSVDNAGGTTVNGGLAYSRAVELIQLAISAWSPANVTSCPGPTTWNTQYTGQFSSPAGPAAVSADNVNRVIFLSGANWTESSTALAQAVMTRYDGMPFKVAFDGDIRINNNHAWAEPCPGVAGKYDLITAIAHETGHFLGLNHSATAGSIMLPTQAPAYCQRALSSSDIQDVCTLYPPAPVPATCEISVSPTSGGASTPFAVTWKSNAPACTWSLDGVAQGAIACSGSVNQTQALGAHTVTLNTGSSSCTATFTVVAAPTCTISVNPASGGSTTTFTASWNSNGSTCTVGLDAATPSAQPCGSSKTYNGLASGKHVVTLRATGLGGANSCSDDFTIAPPSPTGGGAGSTGGGAGSTGGGSGGTGGGAGSTGGGTGSTGGGTGSTGGGAGNTGGGAGNTGGGAGNTGGGIGSTGGGAGSSGGGSGDTGGGAGSSSGSGCSSSGADNAALLTLFAFLLRRRAANNWRLLLVP